IVRRYGARTSGCVPPPSRGSEAIHGRTTIAPAASVRGARPRQRPRAPSSAAQTPASRWRPRTPRDQPQASASSLPRSKRDLGPLVFHALGLVVPPGQTPGVADLHAHADAEAELEVLGQRLPQAVALAVRQCRRGVEAHEDVVETIDAAEDDLEFVDVAMG